MSKKERARAGRGAVLVEGVIALGLLIFGAVVGTLLLANTGLSVFYKEKLGFVTNQAALVAAGIKEDDPQLEEKVREATDRLLNVMGLPKAKEIKVDSSPSLVSVAVKLENLPLMGDGSILPVNISLSDTGAALRGDGSGSFNAEGFIIVGGKGDSSSFGAIVPVVAFIGVPGRGESKSNQQAINSINKSGKPVDGLGVRLTNLNDHSGQVELRSEKIKGDLFVPKF